MNSQLPILSIIVPFAAAFIVGIIGNKNVKLRNGIVIGAIGISFILTISLFKPVMMENKIIYYWFGNWAPVEKWAVGIGLGVDSLSLLLAIIVSLSTLLSSIYSIRYMSDDNGLEKYYPLFLLLTGSMMGFVLTGDFFNMYVMLEIMTFAAISLTAFRTYKYQSIEAAFKYIVIGSLGSSLILLGTVVIYARFHTLNIAQIGASLSGNYDAISIFALAMLLGGYAVKAFLVPCHTWPPDAHMAAPSSISMILSSVMSKTGVYAIIRILYTMYQSMNLTSMHHLIVFWGTITMVVGITMAVVQNDFKRMLAFSSVSQIGYIFVGVGIATPLGITAGIYHIINHVVFKSLLFLCAGAVYFRTHTTNLNEMGGLARKMPYTTALFIAGTLSIGGIPPFNGFVSKWLIYQASFEAGYEPVTVIALVCSVLSLAAMLKVLQSVFFGQLSKELEDIKEVPKSMLVPMEILTLLSLISGIFPTFMDKYLIRPVVSAILNSGYYIDSIMGMGYFNEVSGNVVKVPELTYTMAGYNPVGWLIIFGTILIAFSILVLFLNGAGKERDIKTAEQFAVTSENSGKYDVFTGGEDIGRSSLGGFDIFWGLKHELSKYFGFIQGAHNGIVNDYVLWVVGTAAVVSVYLLLAL